MAINFNAPSQVRPYANFSAFPATGAVKTVYIAEDTNYMYRWNGTAYEAISVADLVGYVPYTGATGDVNLGAYDAYVSKLWLYDAVNDNYGSTHYTDGNYHIEDADGHKLLVIEDGFMQIHKTDTIQSNLYTSGLTATRDHYLPNASGTLALTSDIVSGITIGTTAIASGTVGRVLFQGTGNVVSQSANLFWDNTNGRLGIGTSSPAYPIDVRSTTQGTTLAIRNNGTSGQGNSTAQLYLSNIDGYTSQLTLSNNGIVLNTHGNASTFTINGYLSVGSLFRVVSTGNVLINTTTDAGFKLDVNGSARVSATLTALQLNITGAAGSGHVFSRLNDNGTPLRIFNWSYGNSSGNTWVNGSEVASSLFALNSTTQGFLCPRMTTTQINAIASPAEGLQVYNTTISHMCFYQAGSWVRINHSPM